ncbi:MAG: SPASM domain-containing protein [Candidatus Pacebacteria bacterium]|nr:SPASM domain-containing protein [Candidatus Paceibacterota bacterium]
MGKKLVKLLIKEKLLVDKSFDYKKEIVILGKKLKKEVSLNVMYLLVTDGCNFKCAYCFEDTPLLKEKFQKCHMDESVANKAIEKFGILTKKYGSAKKKHIINIYGGEPLLNKKVVYSTIIKIRQDIQKGYLPKNTEIVIITNGSLITEKTAKFFATNRVNVGISIDGPQGLNNEFRIAKNSNTNPFVVAQRGYELLKKHNVNMGISATLTPAIINNQETALDFFINDLGVKNGMSFNILHYSPTVKIDANYYTEAAKFLIRAFDKFRTLGLYEERMVRKASSFISKEQIFADCGIVGGQIIVAPDGSIGVCQDFIKPRDYFDGSVLDDEYDPVKNRLFKEWENRSPIFTAECFGCEAIAFCGGGCPASVELKTGNRWNIDERICPHSKLSLEWLIWDTYFNLKQ